MLKKTTNKILNFFAAIWILLHGFVFWVKAVVTRKFK